MPGLFIEFCSVIFSHDFEVPGSYLAATNAFIHGPLPLKRVKNYGRVKKQKEDGCVPSLMMMRVLAERKRERGKGGKTHKNWFYNFSVLRRMLFFSPLTFSLSHSLSLSHAHIDRHTERGERDNEKENEKGKCTGQTGTT